MWQRILLIFFILSGLVFRFAALNDPVTYDEAYTYIGFASHGLWAALSDYSLPNNHILHSVLVVFSTSLLGSQPWALRLPALLAGLALIPAVYGLGRRVYNPTVGLLAAALVAWFPGLMRYSVEARGYSLLGLFTLLAVWLAHAVLQSNRPREWALLGLGTALGFFALPLMLYPAGGIYLWLALEGPKKRDFFIRWFGSGVLAGGLTLLAYAPALFVSGWRKIIANGFVLPVEAGRYFDGLLFARLKQTWLSWIGDVPPALTGLLLVGFCLSLAWHRRMQTTRWPLSLVLLAWVAILVITRRPEAFDRFWSWLLAPALLWAAAGLVEAVKKVRVGQVSGQALLTGVALAGLIIQLTVTIPSIPQRWAKMGNQEAVAIFLAEHWQTGDLALVGYPNEAQVWYYLARQGLPETAWQPGSGVQRLWLVLAANQQGQTLEGIIKNYRLDPAAFDLAGASPLNRFGKLEIYLAAPGQ